MHPLAKLLALFAIVLGLYTSNASLLFSNSVAFDVQPFILQDEPGDSVSGSVIAPGQTWLFTPNIFSGSGEFGFTSETEPNVSIFVSNLESYEIGDWLVDFYLNPVEITVVPEPTAFSLFLLGFFTFGSFYGFGWAMRTTKAIGGAGHMGTAD